MSAIKCPCKGCENRTPTCHSSCDGYKEYRQKLDEVKKAKGADVYTSYIINAICRRKKAKNEKNRT